MARYTDIDYETYQEILGEEFMNIIQFVIDEEDLDTPEGMQAFDDVHRVMVRGTPDLLEDMGLL